MNPKFALPSLLLATCLSLGNLSAADDLSAAKTAQAATDSQSRVRTNFDDGWFFAKEDVEGAQKVDFDHSQWRKLDLPHDWSAEGPFDQKAPAGAPGGFLPCGIGWYRKTFTTPTSDELRTAIEFDGVYKNSEVWINGHSLGKRPFGYLGFQYDLTPHLKSEGENVLAVRVDNSLQPSSRWYTGSGIYRHVWLTQTDRIHVTHWGTAITTPEITKDAATVAVETTVRNDSDREETITVKISAESQTVSTEVTLAPKSEQTVAQKLKVPQPRLWSPDSPNLYSLSTELLVGDKQADAFETTFGIREFRFDKDKGFFLNGESLILKGMCNHDDLGPLGVALWDDALKRRLVMLKEMGCNSIRTAHNPSSPELMDLCDEMGFLVVNETFDKWRYGWKSENGQLVANRDRPAVRYGYHLHIDEWWERDLSDHIKRDFNHPSVIMWSIGNEVPEAQKYGETETLIQMRDLCHKLDPSRPVTAGCNFIAGANESGFAELLDIVGYNGGGGSCFQYEQDKLQFPERKMYASEVPHSLQTRGEYRTLSRYREPKHQPADLTAEEVFPETHNKYESSYDNAGVRISSRDSWRLTRDFEFMAGEFRWTGFDYIGESGGWPRVLGNFGIIDLCNFPKDTYYFYQSQWTEEPMAHLLPHWTWTGKEGTDIPVQCYTNCDSAELFLNGESLGVRTFTEENDMHLQWMVPFQAGEIRLEASIDGEVVVTTAHTTAGPPAAVKLSSDRDEVSIADRQLAYVTLTAEDGNETMSPKAAVPIQLSIEGPGRILAVCNGDPMDSAGFQRNNITTFNGLASVIIAPTGEAGSVTLTTQPEGLPEEKIVIEMK
ncbi:glycoside hydrolase family 2 TIM barrel-domain containing protein [Roseibacillus persicicus]|uniref:glycoside hydrolase family 2 TIM barrel-domain containing protein n=1 Tax=Roseibacillus persicicus TaxID=454148 RepID=UPI00280FB5DB|nr:glycoside hydrolase family 2 TIM barrel-domain containing protein [Roseibacillus persicicus]MDQ8188760.1 glycoside hydrolase family 2 TIM barrel-domain containing protein [Roseibacillus persicicus]